jgi:hypothetical protein
VRAYQQLAALQGHCIPVLEAAGVLLSLDEVIVAVSGGQRITTGEDAAVDDSRRLRFDALESLRRIHDCGVLHGNVATRNLFVQERPEVRFVAFYIYKYMIRCKLWSQACLLLAR